MKEKMKQAVKSVRQSIELICYNIRPMFIFTLFFAIFNLLGIIAIVYLLTNISIFVLGIKYLGPDNLMSYILYPPTWVIILLGGILFSFFAIFEIAGLTHALSMSKLGKKTSFAGILLASIKASNKSLLPKNWAIIIFIIVIFPLTGIITFSSATYAVKIPEFISDFLIANKLYCVIYILVYLFLLVIEYEYVFSFNYYVLEKVNFIEACKKSKKIIKKHYIETTINIIFMSILFFMFATSISAIVVETMLYFSSENSIFIRSNFFKDFQILLKGFIYAVFSPIFNIACITNLFFKYGEEENQMEEITQNITDDDNVKLKKVIWLSIILVFLIAFNTVINAKILFPKNNKIDVPVIVAHRGDSVRAPENTMPAFKLAVNEEVPYIEFDVHETKDNIIIVSHDDNLKRVTGKDVCVHDLTYEEVMQLDTGKWFSNQYENTKFSTLDETLKFLKPYNMTIQVEIKPTGYEKNLEENVVSIIRNNNMIDRCMITCLKLEPLLKIEQIAPEIYTVYSMFIASGDLSIIPVDGYTIEERNVTEDLVDRIHNVGKKCFAWTVNTSNRVQYLVDCKVDGILTDNPIMMQNVLSNCDYEGGIKKAIRNYITFMIEGI